MCTLFNFSHINVSQCLQYSIYTHLYVSIVHMNTYLCTEIHGEFHGLQLVPPVGAGFAFRFRSTEHVAHMAGNSYSRPGGERPTVGHNGKTHAYRTRPCGRLKGIFSRDLANTVIVEQIFRSSCNPVIEAFYDIKLHLGIVISILMISSRFYFHHVP